MALRILAMASVDTPVFNELPIISENYSDEGSLPWLEWTFSRQVKQSSAIRTICPWGSTAKKFLNVLADARVAQIAKSYACAPLDVWLLDTVFAGLLHPPPFLRMNTRHRFVLQSEPKGPLKT